MDNLSHDLRYAIRVLSKNPGLTFIVVLTLALGIGANSTMFSVVNAVLLRSLAYEEPERLMMVWESKKETAGKSNPVAPGNFTDWKEQNASFETISAYYFPANFNLSGGGDPERVQAALVTGGFFEVMKTSPILGRGILQEDNDAGNTRVVVISHGLWQRRFGSDPGIINQQININGNNYTVVGVAPPEFRFPEQVELWVPLGLDSQEKENRGSRYLSVVARLKPGVTVRQAQIDMDRIAQSLEAQYPASNKDWLVKVVPIYEQTVGDIKPALLILLGAVGFVLLISCANVANLQLSRAAARQKEMAIRASLGATRGRLIRQLVIENVVLAIAAGALGLALAYWGAKLIVTLNPEKIPRIKEITLDGRVLAFTVVISLLTGFIFGLAPALHTSKPDLNDTLKEGGRGGAAGVRSQRSQKLIVASEVALALVLLVGAGLMLRSFMGLGSVKPGFNPERVLAFEFVLPRVRYGDSHRVVDFIKQSLERLQNLPGVSSAGAVSHLPLGGDDMDNSFVIEGRPPLPPGEGLFANIRWISPDYFKTMEIPLKSGRDITGADAEGSPGVVIINQAMANKFWPDEDPLGKRITINYGNKVSREIVGIVGDVRHNAIDKEPKPEMFVPAYQEPRRIMTIVARTGSDPSSLAPIVRREILNIDHDQPIYNIRTMEQLVAKSTAEQRFNTVLLSVFSIVALILAAVGIYAVIGYSVSRRTHEIGIRMAIGARRSDILKLVVKEGMLLVLAGVVTGLVGAFILTRLMASLLYNISATDVSTYLMLAILLDAVALVAILIPARRATKVDPMIALRYE